MVGKGMVLVLMYILNEQTELTMIFTYIFVGMFAVTAIPNIELIIRSTQV